VEHCPLTENGIEPGREAGPVIIGEWCHVHLDRLRRLLGQLVFGVAAEDGLAVDNDDGVLRDDLGRRADGVLGVSASHGCSRAGSQATRNPVCDF
jgi:hypothetical protein